MPWTAETTNLIAPDGTVLPQQDAETATLIADAMTQKDRQIAALELEKAEAYITAAEEAADQRLFELRQQIDKIDAANRAAKGLQPRRLSRE